MIFRNLLFLSIFFLVGGCGSKPTTPFPKSYNNCNEIVSLPKGLVVDGSFLKDLASCAIKRDEAGRPVNSSLYDIAIGLGEEGLDNILNFFQLAPGAEIDRELPYLESALVLVERGIYESESLLLKSSEGKQAENRLQELLEVMNLYRIGRLLFHWVEVGELSDVFDHLHTMFAKLPDRTLSAIVNTSLSDSGFLKDITVPILGVLAEDSLYQGLTKVLHIETSKVLVADSLVSCLSTLKDPILAGDDSSSEVCPPAAAEQLGSAEDGVERLKSAFLNPDTKSGLLQAAHISLKNILDRPLSEKRDVSVRLINGLKSFLTHSRYPIRDLAYFLSLAVDIEGKGQKPAENFRHLALDPEGLIPMILSFPENLNVQRKRAASMKMQSLLAGYILNGWPGDDNCAATLGILESGILAKDFDQRLGMFFGESCADMPLVHYILANEMHSVCKNFHNSGDLPATGPGSCDSLYGIFEEIPLDIDVTEEVELSQNIDSEILKEFVKDIFSDIALALKKDSLHLWYLGVANGRVAASLFEKGGDVYEAFFSDQLSLASLASSERAISEDPLLTHLFKNDFMERLLQEKVEYYQTLADEFADDSSDKLLRVMSGTYTGGPFTQLVRSKLSTNIVGAENSSSVVMKQHFMWSLGHSRTLFKVPDKLPSLGSGLALLYLDKDMNYSSKKLGNLFSVEELFGDSESNRYSNFDESISEASFSFISKDGRTGREDIFQDWLENSLVPYIENKNADGLGSDMSQGDFLYPGARRAYFQGSDLGFADKRRLAFFFLQNYFYAPYFKVSDNSLAGEPFSLGIWPSSKLYFEGITRSSKAIPWVEYKRFFPAYFMQESLDLRDLANGLFPAEQDEFWGGVRNIDLLNLLSKPAEEFDDSARYFMTFNLLAKKWTERSVISSDMPSVRRYGPVIGFDGSHCSQKDGSQGSCPIDLTDASFLEYKNLMAKPVFGMVCKIFDLGFDPADFGIIGSKEVCQDIESDIGNLFELRTQENIPDYLAKAILKDVISLGGSPQLAAGLKRLPFALRVEKMQQKLSLGESIHWEDAVRGAIGIADRAAAKMQQRKSQYRNFVTHGRSDIEALSLNIIDIDDAFFTARILELGDGFGRVEGGVDSGTAELLRIFQGVVSAGIENGKSQAFVLLKFISDVFKPENEHLRDALVLLLSDLESSGSGTNLASIASIAGGVKWSEPGYRLLKQVLRLHNFKGLSAAFSRLTYQDTDALLNILHEVLTGFGEDASLQEHALKPLVQLLRGLTLSRSSDSNQLSLKVVEEIVDVAIHTSFGDEFFTQILRTVHRLSDKSDLVWQDLSGRKVSPLFDFRLSDYPKSLEWLITDVPVIFKDYQANMFEEQKEDPSYLKQAMAGVLLPLVSRPEANRDLLELLSDQRLGFSGDIGYWDFLLGCPDDACAVNYRDEAIQVLESLSKVDRKLWQRFLVDLRTIVPGASHIAKIGIDLKLKPNVFGRREYTHALNTFYRLGLEGDSGILGQQLDIAELWMEDKIYALFPFKLRGAKANL